MSCTALIYVTVAATLETFPFIPASDAQGAHLRGEHLVAPGGTADGARAAPERGFAGQSPCAPYILASHYVYAVFTFSYCLQVRGMEFFPSK